MTRKRRALLRSVGPANASKQARRRPRKSTCRSRGSHRLPDHAGIAGHPGCAWEAEEARGTSAARLRARTERGRRACARRPAPPSPARGRPGSVSRRRPPPRSPSSTCRAGESPAAAWGPWSSGAHPLGRERGRPSGRHPLRPPPALRPAPSVGAAHRHGPGRGPGWEGSTRLLPGLHPRTGAPPPFRSAPLPAHAPPSTAPARAPAWVGQPRGSAGPEAARLRGQGRWSDRRACHAEVAG